MGQKQASLICCLLVRGDCPHAFERRKVRLKPPHLPARPLRLQHSTRTRHGPVCLETTMSDTGKSTSGSPTSAAKEKLSGGPGSGRAWKACSWRYNRAMKRDLTVVLENGMLRPLDPMHFAERQQLVVSVSDAAGIPAVEPAPRACSPRSLEQTWLKEHGNEFVDQWVVVEGDRLISHGSDAKAVFEEARATGVTRPFLVQVAGPDDLPWGGL